MKKDLFDELLKHSELEKDGGLLGFKSVHEDYKDKVTYHINAYIPENESEVIVQDCGYENTEGDWRSLELTDEQIKQIQSKLFLFEKENPEQEEEEEGMTRKEWLLENAWEDQRLESRHAS